MIRFLGTVALLMSGSFVFDPPEASQHIRDSMDRVGRQVTCIIQASSPLHLHPILVRMRVVDR